MSVKKVFSSKRKPGWHWNEKLKQSWSWAVDIRLATGKRKRTSGFWDEAEAYAVLGKIRQAERDAKFGFLNSLTRQPTIKELAARRLSVIATRNERIRAQRVFAILVELLGAQAKVPDVTTADLQKYTERRIADGLQPQSVSREWNIIAAAFNSARDYFPDMRDWVPPSFPRPKGGKQKRRQRLISPEEIMRLLTWFYEPQREGETAEAAWNRRTVGQAFHFALLTSARRGSILQLRWTDIDLEKKVALITDIKNIETADRPVRPVPLVDEACAILAERKERWKYPFVFTRTGADITHYYSIWKAAAKATGVNYGQKAAGGFRPHDARHTAATTFYRQSKDLTVVRGFTGHESDQLFVYLHEDEGKMREAAEAMSEYIKSGAK